MVLMMLVNIVGIPIEFISLVIGVLGLIDLGSLFDGGDKMNVNALMSKVKNGAHEVNL